MKRNPLVIILLAVVLSLSAIGIVMFLLQGGEVQHAVIIHYHDGTETTLIKTLDITYNNKRVDTIEYRVLNEDLDLSDYHPYFQTPFGHVPMPHAHTIQVFKLLNYTLDDGEYEITLVPEGTILKNGKEVPLPNQIAFTMKVEDNRVINISVE